MVSGTEMPMPAFGFRGFYDDPIWLREAFKYEKKLAITLGNSEPVLKAARETLRKLRNVLSVYFRDALRGKMSETEITNAVADAFFTSYTISEGQTGVSGRVSNAIRLQRLIDGVGDANIRVVMTAIYNGAYYRNQLVFEKKDEWSAAEIAQRIGSNTQIAFLTILRETYLENRPNKRGVADLDLNTASLSDYLTYLDRGAWANFKDMWLVRPEDRPRDFHFGRDFYTLGNMANRAGASYYRELSYGQIRIVDNVNPRPEYTMGSQSPADYLRAGNPLSAEELSVLEDDQTTVMMPVSSFDIIDTAPNMTADGKPDLEAMKAQDQVQGKGAISAVYPTEDKKWMVVRTRDEAIPWSQLRQGDLANFVRGMEREKIAGLVKEGKTLAEAQELAKMDLARVQGPEFPVQWRNGMEPWEPLTQRVWAREAAIGRGLPVKSVISGTTARMMATFCWLNVKDIPARHFMYAVMAWMIPEHDHTMYEVLRGANMALEALNSPCQDPEYFAKLRENLDSIDAVPLYSRFYRMLTVGPWAEPNIRDVPDPIEPLCQVYRYKANDPTGNPFRDLRLFDLRAGRPGEYEEAANLSRAAPGLALTVAQIAAIRYCTGPGYRLIEAAGREKDGTGERVGKALAEMLMEHINSARRPATAGRADIPWILTGNNTFDALNARLRACQLRIRAPRDAVDVEQANAEIDLISQEFSKAVAEKLDLVRLVAEVQMHAAMAVTGLDGVPKFTGTTWRVMDRRQSGAMGSESTTGTIMRASGTQQAALHGVTEADGRTDATRMLGRAELTSSGRDVGPVTKAPDSHYILVLPETTFRVTSTARVPEGSTYPEQTESETLPTPIEKDEKVSLWSVLWA